MNADEGHSKYLSLAQLMEGQDSLGLYRKAIQIMEAAGATTDPDGIKREMSSAYCAIAELFMTDLCDEAEAETECEAAISKAVEVDSSNPEAWQTKARLELIRNEFEAAKASMKTSTDLWLPQYVSVMENKPTVSDFDPVEPCSLLYTTRVSTAKILIELEEWETATQVLDGLVEEDEDVVQIWYLLGWLNKLRADFEAANDSNGMKEETSDARDTSEGYKGNARFYLKKALQVHKKSPTDDDQLIGHINELIEELGEAPEEEEEEDDADWEDCGSSEDDNEENGMDDS